MMRTTNLILLCLISTLSFGQKFTNLSSVAKPGKVKPGHAIIYGSFVQRIGFKSGGFGQYVFLRNVESQKVYRFNVKPTFKSAKENPFIYHIPAGTYTVVQYVWTESKWYGGQTFQEPILKQQVTDSVSRYYTLRVNPDQVIYVGTWDFGTDAVTFKSAKDELDPEMQKKFKKLDFSRSAVILPE